MIIAKNYLSGDEIDSLNRLVVIFLEQAELRVKEHKQLSLDYWKQNVDRLLEFNDRPVLHGPGSVSHDRMKVTAEDRYASFDRNRRQSEALEEDRDDLKQLEDFEEEVKRLASKGNGGPG